MLILNGVLLTLGAVYDWRMQAVPGLLCFSFWVTVIATFALCNTYMIVGVVLFVLMLVFYLPLEIPMFGDADILPIAAYIAFFIRSPIVWIESMFPLFSFMLALYPSALVYCKSHNIKYKLFSGMMIPAFPAFACAWWCSIVELFLYRVFIR